MPFDSFRDVLGFCLIGATVTANSSLLERSVSHSALFVQMTLQEPILTPYRDGPMPAVWAAHTIKYISILTFKKVGISTQSVETLVSWVEFVSYIVSICKYAADRLFVLLFQDFLEAR